MKKVNNTSLIQIKELAEFIALKYNSFKVPIEEIVQNEGIRLIYAEYGSNSFDGMTVYDNNNFYIHLNTDKGNKRNSTRGRFTLAHELGHYFLDSHRTGLKMGLLSSHPSFLNRKSHNKIEREADYFASCLLMPEQMVCSELHRKKFSFDLIQKLSEKHSVSITACAIRFVQIGHHPIMIIYAENGLVKWKITSNDFPFKWLLLDDNRIPENTVTGEYFQKNNTEDVRRPEKVWAVDWFKYVKDSDIERTFYEYCLPYKNKATSIIWED